MKINQWMSLNALVVGGLKPYRSASVFPAAVYYEGLFKNMN